MTKTEQGEFELVLGNKQLLSVFFIVVVLLTVFFFMGYVVGRNSTSAPARAASSIAAPDVAAVHPSPLPQPAAHPSAVETPPSTSQGAAAGPVSGARPESQAGAPSQPEAGEPQEAAGPQSIAQPPAGTTWLQVVATSRPDAQFIAETLSHRHFGTQVAPGPNGLFRVLVGPAKDAAELSELRSRLEADGFRNAMVRKY